MKSDDDEHNVIPARFWKSMSRAEWDEFGASNGWLNAEQCARLWRMEDRQGEPPQSLQVFFNREDVMREFPAEPKKRKSK